MTPQKVSDVDLVFPTSVRHLLPPWESIPAEFKNRQNKWVDVFSAWFYDGLRDFPFVPRPGIDRGMALRHIKACMGSFEPKHEHKEAGVAYLLSQWFEDVQ